MNSCTLNTPMELKTFMNVGIEKLCIIAAPSENTHTSSLETEKNDHWRGQTQVTCLSIK